MLHKVEHFQHGTGSKKKKQRINEEAPTHVPIMMMFSVLIHVKSLEIAKSFGKNLHDVELIKNSSYT